MNIMIRDQHTDSPSFQAVHDILNIFDSDRIDTGKRFIQKNEPRVGDQGSGDLRPASFAAGQIINLALWIS